MGFHNGSYINIWKFEVNESGKSGIVDVQISKKNEDGSYKKEFRNRFVRVAGAAFEQLKGRTIEEGSYLRARIVNCDVTGGIWDKEKSKASNYQFVIFALAFEGDEGFAYEGKGNQKKAVSNAPVKRKPMPKKQEIDDEEDYDF